MECQIAFETLKQSLITSPILAYPSSNTEFILDTDASAFSIGAVLFQVQEGKERVLAMGAGYSLKASGTTASPAGNYWQ